MRRHLCAQGLLVVVFVSACDDAGPAPRDAALEALVDAPSTLDASLDASPDVSVADDVTSPDAPIDAPSDFPVDAALDNPPDLTVDAALDNPPDLPSDAASDAPVDASRDAPVDAPDTTPDRPSIDAPADIALDLAAPDVVDVRDAVPDLRADAPVDARPDVPPIDAPPGAWRSALFPDDWVPVHAGGRADSMGRFLHDFSFAGYHRGDQSPPYGRGTVVRTVDVGLADGVTNAAPAIQADIDAACAATTTGLRVVFVPAGTYLLRFPTTAATDPALRVHCSNLVLRGAGASATRFFVDDAVNARTRAVIRFAARSYNVWAGTATTALSRDALTPTRTVSVPSTTAFAPGDLVTVRTDLTEAFRVDHGMNIVDMGTTIWPPGTGLGLIYPRRVRSVDPVAGTVTLDAPTRYPMRQRDNARLYKPTGYLTEVGLEALAIGMREHATSAAGTLPGPLGDAGDALYDDAGAAAYAVHGSTAVRMDAVHDGWVRDFETYAPTGNTSGAHVLSIALWLTTGTSRVTVERCRIGRPQYRGGGGNGYLFLVEGDDNLLVDDVATAGRHNFITAHMASSGNVFVRVRAVDSRLSDDSHKFLSQANLYDSVSLDRAWLQAVNRGDDSGGAGHTATQSVFWNTRVINAHATTVRARDGFPMGFAIETAQYGWGYAIGTSGTVSAVATRALTNSNYAMQDQGAPVDFVEGVGAGATLFPASLYDEQLRRRRLRGE